MSSHYANEMKACVSSVHMPNVLLLATPIAIIRLRNVPVVLQSIMNSFATTKGMWSTATSTYAPARS